MWFIRILKRESTAIGKLQEVFKVYLTEIMENKGIWVKELGGPDVLTYESSPVPELSPNQVLVKNSYAGLNYIDNYCRTGVYKMQLPYVSGREAGGEIVKIGSEVKNFAVGDKVGYIKVGAFAT